MARPDPTRPPGPQDKETKTKTEKTQERTHGRTVAWTEMGSAESEVVSNQQGNEDRPQSSGRRTERESRSAPS